VKKRSFKRRIKGWKMKKSYKGFILLCAFITLVSLSCKSKTGEPKTDQKTEKIEIEIKYIISTGYLHTCAIDKNDSLWCWGDNKSGQLGDGTNKPSNIPKMIMQDVSQVEMGANHTCAIKKDGSLWCWGDNSFGQIGDGTYTNRNTPKLIMSDVLQVSAGENHTCAIKKDGSLWCWGRNFEGQVGAENYFKTHPVAL
jgi:Alpha-tubulin suppressor and related RCC1 domain-containing proteins